MKQVRFNDNVQIHQLNDELENRRSVWETIAVDRFRFMRRIQQLDVVLTPILVNKIKITKEYLKRERTHEN